MDFSPNQFNNQKESVRQGFARASGFHRAIHFHSRRIFSKTQDMSAGYHTTGPITFLLTAGAIGFATTLSTLYTTSYGVSIDGVHMGIVSQQEVVLQAISDVQKQGEDILGEKYQVENVIEYEFGLHLKSELTDSTAVEHYLYSQLDDLGTVLARHAVMFQGKQVAVLENEGDLQKVLDDIIASYATEETVSGSFVEDIHIEIVYDGKFTSTDVLFDMLTENTTGETEYTVQTGDTFNAIAYNNDMSASDLKALNPSVDPDRLYVGNVISVKEVIPLLSVILVNEESYLEAIPCPVEEVNDSSLYKGNSKVLTQGEEGEADVIANVSYLNGREVEREILESTTLREPTVTVKAVGTAERPAYASYGSYIWPTTGRISSYFGARTLYGAYNYHSGLDIATDYGTPVIAADGGTVTYSGWKDSYGNIVILTHDNGQQTYYAHNSSLVVSVGQKVARGQTIAKVGSTGNSTGNHLHFEVRINGQAVNPLSYLP